MRHAWTLLSSFEACNLAWKCRKDWASPFQQILGFTQMLRIFRVDTSNAKYTFQFLRDKDPFFRYGHKI